MSLKFPATDFLKDLIKMDQGQLTKAQIRANWKAGAYTGLRADWAAEWMKGK